MRRKREMIKSQKNDTVNWEDPALARWMGTITRDSTKHVYRSGFRKYAHQTGLTATQLIDEAIEDLRRDPREKTDIVKRRIIDFYNWLVTEAPKKKRVKGGGTEIVSKGLSSKIGHTYVNAVRSFYGTFDIYVKLKGRSRLPKPRVVNKRMIVNNMDVKRLVDHASSPRDRAMILTMFQGGMDVSTLCDLRYSDVADGLKKGEHPLKLEPFRLKTGTENFTFLGRDACAAIKAYIADVTSRGMKFNHDTPLFLKGSIKALKGEGIHPKLVQAMMRKLVVKAGFISEEEMKSRSFNPLGPHALRESFGSIMTGKGVPDTIVDLWLLHEIGQMAQAYKNAKFEDVRQLYVEREQFISISTGGELEEKLRQELDDTSRQLQTLVNGLATENVELKTNMRYLEMTVSTLSKENSGLKRRFNTFNKFVLRFIKDRASENEIEEMEKVLTEIDEIERQDIEEQERLTSLMKKGKLGELKTNN